MSGAGPAAQDAIGLAAGVLTTIAFVPQLVRILRTRSAYDVSWVMFCILSIGSMLWLWYGLKLGSLPLVLTNVVTLTLQLAIFYLKWRYGRVRGAAADTTPREAP